MKVNQNWIYNIFKTHEELCNSTIVLPSMLCVWMAYAYVENIILIISLLMNYYLWKKNMEAKKLPVPCLPNLFTIGFFYFFFILDWDAWILGWYRTWGFIELFEARGRWFHQLLLYEISHIFYVEVFGYLPKHRNSSLIISFWANINHNFMTQTEKHHNIFRCYKIVLLVNLKLEM